MKNHKVFNARFYVDMLRQLRLIGIAFSIICVVISILVPIANYLGREGRPSTIHLDFSDAWTITPILWGFMYFGGALLVFNAFSFLNKRSASDFYHSMPNTALATWTSTAAAVVTWITGIVVGTVTITMLTYTAFGPAVDWALYPYLVGYFTIGTLLVSAAAMIAVAVTGTTISNVALTGLILFWPRILLWMVTSAIEQRLAIVPMEQFGLLNLSYHIPIGVFHLGNPILFTGAYWYSGMLAVVFFAVAALAYRARRSETAEKSAPSRLLQHVYRSAAVLPIVIAPTLMAVSSRLSLFSFVQNRPEEALLLWGVALVAYYVYELATTKKLKNLLSITPLFLVLALVSSLLVWIGAVALADRELDRLPDAASLEQVTPLQFFQFEGLPDYSSQLTKQQPISDRAVLTKLYEIWERNIRQVKDGTLYQSYSTTFKVQFVFGKKTLTRTLYLTESDRLHLKNLLLENRDFIKVLRTLPDIRHIENMYLMHRHGSVVFGDVAPLWEMLKAELEALDNDTFFALASRERLPALAVRGTVGGRYFFDSFALSPATPESFAHFVQKANRICQNDYADLRGLAEQGAQGSDEIFLTAIFWNIPSLANTQIFLMSDNIKFGEPNPYDFTLRELLSMVSSEAPSDVDPAAPMVEISFEYVSSDPADDIYTSHSGVVYLPLSQAEIDAFVARTR